MGLLEFFKTYSVYIFKHFSFRWNLLFIDLSVLPFSKIFEAFIELTCTFGVYLIMHVNLHWSSKTIYHYGCHIAPFIAAYPSCHCSKSRVTLFKLVIWDSFQGSSSPLLIFLCYQQVFSFLHIFCQGIQYCLSFTFKLFKECIILFISLEYVEIPCDFIFCDTYKVLLDFKSDCHSLLCQFDSYYVLQCIMFHYISQIFTKWFTLIEKNEIMSDHSFCLYNSPIFVSVIINS